jgi:N-acetylglucosaminyldiphosphoundecaprenol N-acetyl-beta-D-mannosaminyltransferase
VVSERVGDLGRAGRLRPAVGAGQPGGEVPLTGPAESGGAPRRIRLAGTPVDLCSREQAIAVVADRLGRPPGPPPLVVASANLDHIHHFGRGGRAHGVIDTGQSAVDWFVLLDGMPLVWRARTVDRSQRWQRLAGSDIVADLLARAEAGGHRVGFLGGTPQTHARLAPALDRDYPALPVAGYWAPERAQLADDRARAGMAEQVRDAGVDLLVVCLGKPRQEAWCADHAAASGAKVCLAFGAAVDFIAGTVSRAPEFLRSSGLEWLYRLALEPRRLSRRYLLQGPPALGRLLLDASR